MTRTVRTFCRNCASICGLKMEVEEGKIQSIQGDAEHPLTEGYLCIKGLTSGDWQNGEDRLTQALTKQTDGTFQNIATQKALDEIHAKLEAIIQTHGAHSVALYYGTGANFNSVCHPAFKGWMHGIGSPYLYSSMTVDQSAKWVTVGRMGTFLTGKYNVTNADVIMLVGNNPMVSHAGSGVPMTNPGKWLREAKKRGLKLIVIDPRRTETAKRADIHVAIDPGADVWFFAGLINIVLQRDWHDQEFCDPFIDGLSALRKAVEPFTPDLVAARSGISTDELLTVAETFASARRKSVHSSTGPNMGQNSNTAEHMIEALNAICGGYKRAGDIMTNLRPLVGNAFPKEMVMPAHRSWEFGPKCLTEDIGPLFGEYPTALLPQEIRGKGEKRIRALICVGGNPMKALPDPEDTVAAFDQLELLVSLDPRMNDTCAHSDYVIATSLPYERHEFTGLQDWFLSHSYANATEPVVDRPDGVIDDWEFFWELANRAQMPLEMKLPMFAAHGQNPSPVLSLSVDEKPETQDIIRWMCGQGATDYETLLYAPQGVLFDELTAEIQPADADGPRLSVCPDDVSAELRAVLNSKQTRARYRFTVRRMLEAMNSAYRRSKTTRRRFETNPLFMNPLDMEEDGIEPGQQVDVRSRHGAITAVVRADNGLKRGVVSMTHGWGTLRQTDDPDAKNGAHAGRLASLTENAEPINYMPVFTAIPVDIGQRAATAN